MVFDDERDRAVVLAASHVGPRRAVFRLLNHDAVARADAQQAAGRSIDFGVDQNTEIRGV